MAESAVRMSFPMLSPSHWWTLRKKFRQSIPGVITDGYIATIFEMAPNSARANVLPFLKTLGLIDAEGKTTGRVKLWRDDESYADVCRAMLKEIYPDELLNAVPDPKTDRARAERWFANKSGFGESASKRMTAIYTVISEADPSKQPDGERKPAAKKAENGKQVTQRSAGTKSPTNMEREIANSKKLDDSSSNASLKTRPDVNINLQIHISADSTPDQIEQIFASMAKHIYGTE